MCGHLTLSLSTQPSFIGRLKNTCRLKKMWKSIGTDRLCNESKRDARVGESAEPIICLLKKSGLYRDKKKLLDKKKKNYMKYYFLQAMQGTQQTCARRFSGMIRPDLSILTNIQNAKCRRKLKLHITLNHGSITLGIPYFSRVRGHSTLIWWRNVG